MEPKSNKKILKGCRNWSLASRRDKKSAESVPKNIKINRERAVKNKFSEDSDIIILDSNSEKTQLENTTASHSIFDIDSNKNRHKICKTENKDMQRGESNTNKKDVSVQSNSIINNDHKTAIETHENSSLPIIRWNAINKTLKSLYYVVDTNVLLDFRDLLEDIAGKVYDNYQLIIIIPYSAIKELDGLKRSKKVAISKVQNTIKWCNKHIEANISWIKGQPYMHYVESSQHGEECDADGQIRNCALSYMKTKKNVALITNDINLKNRAILCGLKAYNIEQLYKMLDDTSFIVGKLPLDNNISQYSKKKPSRTDDKSDSDINLSSYLNAIRTSIAQSLSGILKDAMFSTFGDLWDKIVIIKPPWTSSSVLRCFRKHWVAVFLDKLPNKVQSSLECVQRNLESIPVMPTRFATERLANNVLELYDHFKETEYAIYIKRFKPLSDPVQQKPEEMQLVNIINFALNDIGKYSNAILLHNKQILNEFSETESNKEKAMTVICSLRNLQTTLISLGYTFIRFTEAPTMSAYSDIQIQLKNFWTSAECCERNVVITYDQYVAYSSTRESQAFLQNYTKELETVINKIRQVLSYYERDE